jgi:argonaute-like protein implicated in RNA metabolism and viral defense
MKPQRLVIHKTSEFRKDEIKGLSEVLEESGIFYDLITLKKSSLRLLRYGNMPVPRGSMFSMDKNTYFLYTKGFIPELRTYPGVHVPAPFEIRKARGDSSYKEICKEILALTKLNWNTADFCSGLPITIGFSRNVGQVLKVFDENDSQEPEKVYRFYM